MHLRIFYYSYSTRLISVARTKLPPAGARWCQPSSRRLSEFALSLAAHKQAIIISPLHTSSIMSLNIARCAVRRAAPALRRSFCSHTRPALGALTSKQYSVSGDIQSRPFSSKDSDDDFAPKRKAVPEGADDVSKMIQQQVHVAASTVACVLQQFMLASMQHQLHYIRC
jgi:hypothetical protein